MANDITDIVGSNRKDLRRSVSRFVSIDDRQENGIFYGRTNVYTTVSTDLVGDSIGDRRSGAVTIGGHEQIAASFVDQGTTPAAIVYGDGTSEATRFDTALGNQVGSLSLNSSTTSGGLYDDPGDIILTSASTTSTAFTSGGFEVGVEDGAGNLLTREVYDEPASIDSDLQFETTITLAPTVGGPGIFTDSGVKAFTDAVIASKNVLRAFTFSDQDDALDTDLTDLPNELYRATIATDLSGGEVVASARVTTSDTPSSGFPYTIKQGGVDDDTGDLVFAADNRDITLQTDTEYTAQVSVVVEN